MKTSMLIVKSLYGVAKANETENSTVDGYIAAHIAISGLALIDYYNRAIEIIKNDSTRLKKKKEKIVRYYRPYKDKLYDIDSVTHIIRAEVSMQGLKELADLFGGYQMERGFIELTCYDSSNINSLVNKSCMAINIQNGKNSYKCKDCETAFVYLNQIKDELIKYLQSLIGQGEFE
jgi:hypothetical protein